MNFKVGDQILVISSLSAFYGMRGEIEVVSPTNKAGNRSYFEYLCRIKGYKSADGSPVPFMKHEIRPLPLVDPTPLRETGGSVVGALSVLGEEE